jgi:hypothetical protein
MARYIINASEGDILRAAWVLQTMLQEKPDAREGWCDIAGLENKYYFRRLPTGASIFANDIRGRTND